MINVSNFPNAYKEVYTIMKYIDKKDLALIPQEFIEMIKTKMNEYYNFEYDINCSFDQQKILRETKAIFAYIFLNYWASEEQAKLIREQFKEDLKHDEIEKNKKYNPNNIFKSKRDITRDTDLQSSNQIIEYRDSIFTKFKKFIKTLWRN